jgi:hypothetical protein
MSLPLFGELEKIIPLPPSLIASLKCENPGLKTSQSVHSDSPKSEAKNVLNEDARATLTNLVPPLEKMKMAERGGFESPVKSNQIKGFVAVGLKMARLLCFVCFLLGATFPKIFVWWLLTWSNRLLLAQPR